MKKRFGILLCFFTLSILVEESSAQMFYQKSWLVDLSAGTSLKAKDEGTPLQVRLSGGYEVQFNEPEILGVAFRIGYTQSRGYATVPYEMDSSFEIDDLLYAYNGSTLFIGISPMIIFEQFDSNFDRLFIEYEFGIASNNAQLKIYEPTAIRNSQWTHFDGYFMLKAGFRIALKSEGGYRALSIWGSLHNQSPINAIIKSIPKNWPYKFKEDLKHQWQIGISYYI
jgi:hypothetical protein